MSNTAEGVTLAPKVCSMSNSCVETVLLPLQRYCNVMRARSCPESPYLLRELCLPLPPDNARAMVNFVVLTRPAQNRGVMVAAKMTAHQAHFGMVLKTVHTVTSEARACRKCNTLQRPAPMGVRLMSLHNKVHSPNSSASGNKSRRSRHRGET